MNIIKRKLAKTKQELLLSDGKRFLDPTSFYSTSAQEDFDDNQQDFNDYINGDGESGRYNWATLHDMDKWHRERSRNIALVEDRQETQHLAQAAHYGYWCLRLGPQVTSRYRTGGGGADVWLLDVSLNLATLLILGHFSETAEVTIITAPELHAPYLNGGLEYFPHAWFLLDLCCRWQGFELDTTGCDIPPDMYVYADVLNDWDTKDVERVQALVTAMAEHHMKEAKENMGAEEMNEFAGAEFWLFPYEILAWLKLRQHLGLPNPEHYEHPLMHLPQAQMPADTAFPDDPLLDKVVQKLMLDHDISLTD